MTHPDISIEAAGSYLQTACHTAAKTAGWWTDMASGESLCVDPMNPSAPLKFNVPEKLCLVHSEISEGMEGFRKRLPDDKLPHRPMLEVELADAVIRCFDLAGGLGYDLGGAIKEKLAFNATRADHKLEVRGLVGGKKF